MGKDNGGPAFGEFQQVGDVAMRDGGLSIRDYFAAKAMQGVLSSPSDPASFEAVGVFAYKVADAMLAERDK